MKFRTGVLRGALAALGVVIMTSFAAAEYPTKPVTLVAPYGPGGASDLAARIVSATAPGHLGNGILVVNMNAAWVQGSGFKACTLYRFLQVFGVSMLGADDGTRSLVVPRLPFLLFWASFHFSKAPL